MMHSFGLLNRMNYRQPMNKYLNISWHLVSQLLIIAKLKTLFCVMERRQLVVFIS